MISNYMKLLRFDEWLPAFAFILIGYILTRSVALKDAYTLLAAFLSFLLIGSFGFIINDYFDRDFDKKKKDNRNPISSKLVSERSAIVLSLLSAISGLALSYSILPKVFPLFIAYFVLLTLYSAPPFRLKEKSLLDVISFCSIIPILFLVGYMLFREISVSIIMLAIEFFILNIVIEVMQEIRDYNADMKSGFKTTVIGLGIENSIKLIRVIMISFIVMFSLTIGLYFPLYFLLLLVSLVPLVRFVFSRKIETDIVLPNVGSRGTLILVIILLIILPLWYGLL